jgi:hypothetical protein
VGPSFGGGTFHVKSSGEKNKKEKGRKKKKNSSYSSSMSTE